MGRHLPGTSGSWWCELIPCKVICVPFVISLFMPKVCSASTFQGASWSRARPIKLPVPWICVLVFPPVPPTWTCLSFSHCWLSWPMCISLSSWLYMERAKNIMCVPRAHGGKLSFCSLDYWIKEHSGNSHTKTIYGDNGPGQSPWLLEIGSSKPWALC